jgi:hypothetical protein
METLSRCHWLNCLVWEDFGGRLDHGSMRLSLTVTSRRESVWPTNFSDFSASGWVYLQFSKLRSAWSLMSLYVLRPFQSTGIVSWRLFSPATAQHDATCQRLSMQVPCLPPFPWGMERRPWSLLWKRKHLRTHHSSQSNVIKDFKNLSRTWDGRGYFGYFGYFGMAFVQCCWFFLKDG